MEVEEARVSAARTEAAPQHVRGVKPLLVAIGAVLLIILARLAFDVFAVLVFVVLIGVLRRTAGDWLGDVLGVRGGTVAFAVIIGGGGWWLAGTDSGRNTVGRFFSEAGRLGFNSVIGGGMAVPSSSGPSSVPAQPISPTPAQTSGGGSVSPARSSGQAAPSSSDAAKESPVSPSRITVRATKTGPDRIVLQATVSAAGGVPGGTVEFSVDGRVVATTRIRPNGDAEATVSVSRPGSYRVRVRFVGSDQFGPATAETVFSL